MLYAALKDFGPAFEELNKEVTKETFATPHLLG